ncbi:MAG: response regulator [Flavisolibacter sp.]
MKRSYTILYVDDDADDLVLISEAFEKYTDHLSVLHAGNGVEGLKLLEKMHDEHSLPCLVIIDINMPIMDGKQMLRNLREKVDYRELPVIMFSTSNSARDHQFAEMYDAEFVSKPSKYGELKALVAQFVNKCRFEEKKTA